MPLYTPNARTAAEVISLPGACTVFNIQHTKEICSHCGQRIEIEPGYFYAAMYVSYAMNVIEMLVASYITYLFCGPLTDETFWNYLVCYFYGMFCIVSI